MLRISYTAGGFDTQNEAGLAYDIACVRFRGANAHTNFPISGYKFELDHLEEVKLCSDLSRSIILSVTHMQREVMIRGTP